MRNLYLIMTILLIQEIVLGQNDTTFITSLKEISEKDSGYFVYKSDKVFKGFKTQGEIQNGIMIGRWEYEYESCDYEYSNDGWKCETKIIKGYSYHKNGVLVKEENYINGKYEEICLYDTKSKVLKFIEYDSLNRIIQERFLLNYEFPSVIPNMVTLQVSGEFGECRECVDFRYIYKKNKIYREIYITKKLITTDRIRGGLRSVKANF